MLKMVYRKASIRPIVRRKCGKIREGRGFSRKELKQVKLDVGRALKIGIPVDLRRKTEHKENVAILREYLQKMGFYMSEKKKDGGKASK